MDRVIQNDCTTMNPVASINHTKHERDESSHTMRCVGIRNAQSVAICVKGILHFCCYKKRR